MDTDKPTVWDWPLQGHDGVVLVSNTHDKFEVGLDTKYFSPKDIKVEVINNDLVISCHHEKEKGTDDRLMDREMNRCYHLPMDVDTHTLKSKVTGGVLSITAQKKH